MTSQANDIGQFICETLRNKALAEKRERRAIYRFMLIMVGLMLLIWLQMAHACTLPADGGGSYTDNGASVTDNVTSLNWWKTTQQNYTRQYSYAQAVASLPAGTRLPNLWEALSIVDLGRRNPAFDSIFGPMVSYPWPSTRHVPYWTSTPAAGGSMMTVNYNGGGSGPVPVNGLAYVRAVSGTWDCLPFAPRDNGDGTFTVPTTGQMWIHLTGTYTWNQLSFLAGGRYAGYDDWHAPREKELETIAGIIRAWAWSGTPDFGAWPPTCAWGFGLEAYHNDRGTLHDVWLVRG